MAEPTPFPAEKTAVLTGAASLRGIGRAAARRLAGQGWSIAILDLDADEAQAAAAELGAENGVKTIGLGTDVSDGGVRGASHCRG